MTENNKTPKPLTYEQFAYWLKGYLTSHEYLNTDDREAILEQLSKTYQGTGNVPYYIPYNPYPITFKQEPKEYKVTPTWCQSNVSTDIQIPDPTPTAPVY